MNNQQNVGPAKNPGLAAVLSFFYTGLGQIYNGQIAKGIAFLVIQSILLFFWWTIVLGIGAGIFWVYGIYDAYKTAEKINAGIR